MLHQAITHSRLPLCVTDPHEADNPIQYVNAAFCDLTGYRQDEILGRNCRFLQGPETDAAHVELLRQAIINEQVATVELVNYRKDGSKFINALQVGPIFDDSGRLRYFFGSQLDVTARVEAERRAREIADAELRHRLMNILAVLTALVKQTGREDLDAEQKVELIASRIEAVGRAHLITLSDGASGSTDLAQVIEVILRAYTAGKADRFSHFGPQVNVGNRALSAIALTLHELATNAIKHGALSEPDGRVSISWRICPAETGPRSIELTWTEAGGPAVAPPSRSSGSQIVAKLLEVSSGSIRYDWRPDGLVAVIQMAVG